MVPEATVAFCVERICTSGAMLFASGPDEAPELVTAWQTPATTPVQVPSLCEPRASAETAGSTAVAALVTLPLQVVSPEQVRAAPAADAADGPAGIRATFTFCAASTWPAAASVPPVPWPVAGPLSASAAPGPVEAVDTDCTSQPPVAPVQAAVPSEVRGAPFATAPSTAVVAVRTVPEQVVPCAHCRPAFAVAVDDGPRAG